ncbi:MAG: DUF1780 domain-containing protein, partial [Gammaproteobacteria bacterium]|nr:DUF1780 domain-containing protein [Gammaproteobacteria bacterium]
MEGSFFEHQQKHIAALKESIRFFSGPNKFEREKWVVRQLLSALGVAHRESEIIQGCEPADVSFRDARFQVKEIMQFNDSERRLRMREYEQELERVKAATPSQDLSKLTPYRGVTWTCPVSVDSLTFGQGGLA